MIPTIESSPKLSDVGRRAYTSSTLLIPNVLLDFFTKRATFFGGRKYYFEHLIVTYGRNLSLYGLKPVSHKWKKQYQEEGLDLQNRNFKPDPVYWEEFRHIGLAYGLGMCLLFVVLLELEYKRWVDAGCLENFHENPPWQGLAKTFGLNSAQNTFQDDEKSLEKLGLTNQCTILIRSIDFERLKLHRICLIRQ